MKEGPGRREGERERNAGRDTDRRGESDKGRDEEE